MLGNRLTGRRMVPAALVAAALGAGVVWSTDPFARTDDGVEVSARGAVPTARETSPEPAREPPAGPARLGTMVTATRTGETVVVERRDLDTGGVERLFTYEEQRRYPGGDDPNRADPPSVALSPDGRRLAYSDTLNIRIRHLETGHTRTVVSGVSQGEDLPARWSIPEMNTDPETDGVWGIWAVREPEWSPDGQRIAFNQGWWEGSDYGIVDLASGRYHASPGGYDLEWITDDSRGVTAGSFYTESGRVHVARPDRPTEYTDLTAAAPEQRSYEDVAVAPDGQRLAVAWADEPMIGDACCAALLDIHGTLIRQLATGGPIQSIGFATDGSSLFLAERRDGRTVLTRHPVGEGAATDVLVLPSDLYAWTVTTRSDGNLALVGRTRYAYEGEEPGGCEQNCPPYHSRLLVIDPDSAEIRYESADLGRFTAVGGFAEPAQG